MDDSFEERTAISEAATDASAKEPGAPASLLVHHKGGVEVVPLQVGQSIVIGRAVPATLVIRERELSREHARFSLEDNKLWVEDLGSMNGTKVNNRPITRAAFGFDDRVQLPGVTVSIHTLDVEVDEEQESTLHREVAAARRIQERIIGPSGLIECDGLTLAGFYQPASACGGDFWNYFPLGSGKTLIVIGNITDHGLPSAMLTASVKSCCDTLTSTHGAQMSMMTLMRTLNHVVCAADDQPMTLFATLIDVPNMVMTFSSAAHTHPYLCRWDKTQFRVSALSARGHRLGQSPDSEFEEHHIDLQGDDLFVWFTDGLTERESKGGEQWGGRRLRRCVIENAKAETPDICTKIVAECYGFAGGTAIEDDVTLVVGRMSREHDRWAEKAADELI